MGVEIERKFLVADETWRREVSAYRDIRQAYLAASDANSVRVRVAGSAAFLTIKSAAPALSRAEFEYSIPVADAEALLARRTGRLIEKRRHIVPHGALRWEIDVFSGDLSGLVVAEIELPSPDTAFDRPAWLGREVTGDPRYANARLATHGLPGRE